MTRVVCRDAPGRMSSPGIERPTSSFVAPQLSTQGRTILKYTMHATPIMMVALKSEAAFIDSRSLGPRLQVVQPQCEAQRPPPLRCGRQPLLKLLQAALQLALDEG